MCIGFPAATMISRVLRANTCGLPDARLSLATVSMFVVSAEANTSAGAACLIWLASEELPA
jgi:hypothetical protein